MGLSFAEPKLWILNRCCGFCDGAALAQNDEREGSPCAPATTAILREVAGSMVLGLPHRRHSAWSGSGIAESKVVEAAPALWILRLRAE